MVYQSLTGPNDKISDDVNPIDGGEANEAFVGDGETSDAEIEAMYEKFAYGQEAALGNAHILY